MPDEITIKTPMALVTLVVLIVSLTVNIVKFMQPAQSAMAPVGATAVPTANATLPNGQPNPLAHIPKSPGDAVGMPDATGGTGR